MESEPKSPHASGLTQRADRGGQPEWRCCKSVTGQLITCPALAHLTIHCRTRDAPVRKTAGTESGIVVAPLTNRSVSYGWSSVDDSRAQETDERTAEMGTRL